MTENDVRVMTFLRYVFPGWADSVLYDVERKGKVISVAKQYYMKAYSRVEVKLYSFLTATPGRTLMSASCSGQFYPKEK
jgi:hypothetical protein